MLTAPISTMFMPALLAGCMTVFNITGYWHYHHNGEPTNWYKGKSPIFQTPTYEWEGQIHGEPSQYGIKNGRVSKLSVKKNGKEIAHYERGWDIKPRSEEDKQIVEEVLDKIENEKIGK